MLTINSSIIEEKYCVRYNLQQKRHITRHIQAHPNRLKVIIVCINVTPKVNVSGDTLK